MEIERTVVLIKPDAIQRNLLGEVIRRFELKGLKIAGMKMISLSDALLDEHYAHHKDKPFFADLKKFMMSAPVVALILQGENCVKAVRTILGPTVGHEAPAGSIRGDLSMGIATNLVHASDSTETAAAEIERFFRPEEIFSYSKIDEGFIFQR
jgi:nucleoside-diphosphate kinase